MKAMRLFTLTVLMMIVSHQAFAKPLSWYVDAQRFMGAAGQIVQQATQTTCLMNYGGPWPAQASGSSVTEATERTIADCAFNQPLQYCEQFRPNIVCKNNATGLPVN